MLHILHNSNTGSSYHIGKLSQCKVCAISGSARKYGNNSRNLGILLDGLRPKCSRFEKFFFETNRPSLSPFSLDGSAKECYISVFKGEPMIWLFQWQGGGVGVLRRAHIFVEIVVDDYVVCCSRSCSCSWVTCTTISISTLVEQDLWTSLFLQHSCCDDSNMAYVVEIST